MPSGISTWKKPAPLIATSFELPVCVRPPCVYRRSVATCCTPVPSCRPDGSSVCCVEFAPGWRMVWYSRSSNTARDALKPFVLVFARLFEITSICACCAFMPVAAM